MKKTLLATSALVGASLLAAPASAEVGNRGTMNISLSGMYWFSAYVKNEDVSANNGRGYGFTVSESEVYVAASNKADNGITYGVNVELAAGAADTEAVDEAFAHLSHASWGRIEMGDNDDVANQMQVGSWNAMKGAGGPLGGLGDLNTVFGGVGLFGDAFIARSDYQTFTTADDTKMSYRSPNFGGLQVGASWTPDTGEVSGGAATADSDADGDYENVLSLAATYRGSVNDANFAISGHMQRGTDETAAGAENEDLQVYGLGANVAFGGFIFGVNYVDMHDTLLTAAQTAAGADAGSLWAVGGGYQMGPWGVSAWYLNGSKDNTNANDTEVTRYGVGAGYAVAPGWQLRAEATFLSHENASTAAGVGGTVDNDGSGFLLVNRFFF